MTSNTDLRADRYERLAMMARAFTSEIGAEEITRIVVQQGMAGMNASGVGLLFVEGGLLRTVAAVGTTARSIRRLEQHGGRESMPLDRDNPSCQAIREAEEIWITDREEGLRRFADLRLASPRSQGWVAIPLLSGGRPFGAFSLSFSRPPVFDETERNYVRTMADVAALALSRIFEARAAQAEAVADGPRVLIDEMASAVLAAPSDGMVAVDSVGTILQCNQRLGELLGYTPAQLVGRPIEVLLPYHRRGDHVRSRQRYVDDPVPRSAASGLDLVALRSDGIEVPVEISLSPCATRNGLCVLAVVRPRS
ncbi:MAG: GAF domain-containing protein [Acidimicrobiales bacterium]